MFNVEAHAAHWRMASTIILVKYIGITAAPSAPMAGGGHI